LLAVTYGTFGTDRNLPELEDLYHVYALVVDAANGEAASGPLAGYLSRHLLTPKLFGDANYPSAERAEKVSAHNAPAIDVRAEPAGLPTRPPHSSAIEELARLDHGGNVVLPISTGVASTPFPPFTLTPMARASLSQQTRELLAAHQIDLGVTPVHAVVTLLTELAAGSAGGKNGWRDVRLGRGRSIAPAGNRETMYPGPTPLIRPAGVARLLVVKQQIKRYEAAEVAHVENVLSGEKRARTHRLLERAEETFTTEAETTREQENELETAERFELNRETSRTIENDFSVGGGLSLSGSTGQRWSSPATPR
jgi:hypothetical protein